MHYDKAKINVKIRLIFAGLVTLLKGNLKPPIYLSTLTSTVVQ